MDQNEVAAELRRMAVNNGLHFLKEDQLLQVMSNDISAKADFVNIIPSFAERNTFLLINTQSVHAVKTGVLGPKINWSVLVVNIKNVLPGRRLFGNYVIDELRMETTRGALEFRFGFFDHCYDDHKAAIARKNAEIAAHEVALAIKARQPSPSPQGTRSADICRQSQNTTAEQLSRFVLSLSLLTGANSVGRPFGEGLGLESAISLLPQFFPSIEVVRDAGEMIAMTIIAVTAQGQIAPEDLSRVMGTPNLRGSALPADQAAAAENLAGAAYAFLGQIHEPCTSMWELWKKRDDVASEFLCWYAVAWGRLVTTGRIKATPD